MFYVHCSYWWIWFSEWSGLSVQWHKFQRSHRWGMRVSNFKPFILWMLVSYDSMYGFRLHKNFLQLVAYIVWQSCGSFVRHFKPFILLHPASATGVIVLASSVCLSVRLSICLALTAERTDVQTLILAWRSSGRLSRSSSKVKVIGQRSRSPGQKTFFLWDVIIVLNAEETRKWLILLQRKLALLQQAPLSGTCGRSDSNIFDTIYEW